MLSLGLTAPGARFSRFEDPRACVRLLVGVFLLLAFLERELNHEADLDIREVITVVAGAAELSFNWLVSYESF